MKKYAMHTIPAAVALAATLALAGQAQAQTSTTEPLTSRTTPPAGPSVMPKDAQARTDGKMQKNSAKGAKKPAAEMASDKTMPPAGTGAAPKETGGGSPNKTMP